MSTGLSSVNFFSPYGMPSSVTVRGSIARELRASRRRPMRTGVHSSTASTVMRAPLRGRGSPEPPNIPEQCPPDCAHSSTQSRMPSSNLVRLWMASCSGS